MKKTFFALVLMLLASNAFAAAGFCEDEEQRTTISASKEVVTSSETLKFVLDESRLSCVEHGRFPTDYTECSWTLFPYSIGFALKIWNEGSEKWTKYFRSLDGLTVVLEKVNTKWHEYNECTDEDVRPPWWTGHYRMHIEGRLAPLYSPQMNADGEG